MEELRCTARQQNVDDHWHSPLMAAYSCTRAGTLTQLIRPITYWPEPINERLRATLPLFERDIARKQIAALNFSSRDCRYFLQKPSATLRTADISARKRLGPSFDSPSFAQNESSAGESARPRAYESLKPSHQDKNEQNHDNKSKSAAAVVPGAVKGTTADSSETPDQQDHQDDQDYRSDTHIQPPVSRSSTEVRI
jgi:hypothetical protein